jgi:cellulose synthase (UDP-forming)
MTMGMVKRWASALQVEKPQSWTCWLLRLFVLPPAELPVVEPVVSVPMQPPRPPPERAIRRRPLPVSGRMPLGPPETGDASFDSAVLGRAAAAGPPQPAPVQTPPSARPAPPRWRAPFDRLHQRWRGFDFVPWGHQMERWAEAPVWQGRAVRGALAFVSVAAFWMAATTPMSELGQAVFFLAMLALVLVVRRIPGNMPTLVLIGLALLASFRYGWWRVTQSMDLAPGWESLLGGGLLCAELYAWLIMVLGFVQTSRPLKRPVAPIELPRDQWPRVDVFIPTYNEPLSVVGPTVLAARDLDWPADRLVVHVLDDGRRPAVRAFAEAAGVNYIWRSDNRHAKAGNLNHAMARTSGEYIAIFDCDHMPARGFLVNTMGWMLRDSNCALVQTPHHFFSADPFERNLDTFRRVPNEGVLFYGLVQDGNDVWNASFFCGSCAVLRRSALEQIGGIAVETVTEDAHTALKLHRKGWRTAYLNVTHAAGLATESLSGHVRQRIRWARGMAQIFRLDNPLLGRGLTVMQRLCYANAMLHFFYGLPRLIFLTAPLGYLYFEFHIIHASVGVLLLYLLPHLVLPHIANAHIAGPHRHTFWSELYETVLAWYVAVPTTVALFNPHAGKFDVTAKGGLVEETHLDWNISRPYFFLVILNAIGAVFGIFRLFWDPQEWGTITLNMAWTIYNLLALGAAIGVAREKRQVRRTTRVTSRLPASVLLTDGQQINCETEDYALAGVGLQGLPTSLELPAGSWVAVRLYDEKIPHLFPARVVSCRNGRMSLSFERLSLDQQAALIRCTFTRKDAWQNWQLHPQSDRALQGLFEIARLGLRSYADLFKDGMRQVKNHTLALPGWVLRRWAHHTRPL